jgi:hypothetical protein
MRRWFFCVVGEEREGASVYMNLGKVVFVSWCRLAFIWPKVDYKSETWIIKSIQPGSIAKSERD